MRKIALVIILVFSVVAKAQDWYLSTTLTRCHSVSENMTAVDFFTELPGIDISLGDNFSRFFGMRATIGFNPQSGRPGKLLRKAFPDELNRYRFLTFSGYVDGMLNLTELFSEPYLYRTDALYLVFGAGATSTFNFSKSLHNEMWEKYYQVETKGKIYPVARLGLAGSLMLNRNMDLALEATYNLISDRYNGVKHGSSIDGYVDVSVGVSWFFSRRHLQRTELQKLPYEIMDNPLQETYSAGSRMNSGVSFYFGFSNLNAKQRIYVESVANFLKQNPSVNIVLHGYADKEYTEGAQIKANEQLAKERAEIVREYLVTNCEIDASRLSIATHPTPINGYKQNGEWIRGVEFEMK